MVQVKVQTIIKDVKGDIVIFDYFGKERRTLVTDKVRDYLISVSNKDITNNSILDVIRIVQPKRTNPSQMVEMFKIKKVVA